MKHLAGGLSDRLALGFTGVLAALAAARLLGYFPPIRAEDVAPKDRPQPKPTPRTLTDKAAGVCDHFALPTQVDRCKVALSSSEGLRRIEESRKSFRLLKAGDNEVAHICYVSAFFRENTRGYCVLSDENVAAYMQACREVFGELEAEVNDRLRKSLRSAKLRLKLFEKREPPPRTTVKLCRHPGVPDKTDAELGSHAADYREVGLRPQRERIIPVSEIRAAFRRAEVARFDATELLPARFFNITAPALRDLHADVADSIPFNIGLNHGWAPECQQPMFALQESFSRFGPKSEVVELALRGMMPWLLKEECLRTPKLTDLARWWDGFLKTDIPYSALRANKASTHALFSSYEKRNRTIGSGEINMRRLPNFSVNFAKKLGIEDLVLHTHSFLWFGTSAGEFHVDQQDNILMQLTGTADVLVMPANCTQLTPPGMFGDNLFDWNTKGMRFGEQRSPFMHVELRPGQGVVLPSSTKHKVVVRDSRRVGLNAFFEPRFGRMQWPSAPAHQYLRNDKDVLAVRSLWVRTLARVWDARRIGMCHHTFRMEFI